MKTINVIGAGLAGSIVTRMLRRDGYGVRVIDDVDKRSASQASSNLFIASWMAKFKDKGAANGIAIVEELFKDDIDFPFTSGIAAAVKVKHIAQRHILVNPNVLGTVLQVTSEGVDVNVGNRTDTFYGPTVVCTGYRAAQLLPSMKVWCKVGHAFLFQGQLLKGMSRLAIVSPYTHEKLYQYSPGLVYYADSVAVKLEVYEKRRQELYERTLTRARKHIGDVPIFQHRVGYRPFIDGFDFGYAAEVKPNVFTVNGGGKNGIVAYANATSQILPAIKERAA